MESSDTLFNEQRPRLFGIAYHMLGSHADADDVVQDAWVRWRSADYGAIDNVPAYLARIVTNLSIDCLRRLKPERANYDGPWLPQPIVEEIVQQDGIEEVNELAESLSMALLVMLERVPANERASFVLREAFGMSFKEIGQCLDAKPATCRQWTKRARERMRATRWCDQASYLERDLLERFVVALNANDVSALLGVLDDEVQLLSDGGGKVAAARKPIDGPRAVSRFLLGIAAKQRGHAQSRLVKVNGHWGGLIFIDGQLDSILSIHALNAHIAGIYILRNPDKLKGFAERPAHMR